MNHAFSDKALRSSEPFIHSNIDRWIELLKEEIRKRQWSCSLHMARWADRLVFDTLGDLYFGESFGTKERDRELRHIPAISLYVHYSFSTESRKDFFQYLVLALDLETGKGCSNEEVFSESGSLIIAGSDTSAIGLAAAFFYLTRNPHAQEKHAKESRAAFSSVGGIQGGAALHSSQYLRAFIQGTMRMSPPVPTDIAPEVQQVALLLAGDISRRARRPALCPTACTTILICILSHSSFVLNGRLSMRRMSVVILLRVSI
uniref:Uncharacterized protein n=1 Tax=Fusarium oxysporum (strain Fo5176) TaxID=660025 RepID=A0A0D2YCW6_FUSOF